MSEAEQMLVRLIAIASTPSVQAQMLQAYIQEAGPLSEAAAAEVRKLLGEKLRKGN